MVPLRVTLIDNYSGGTIERWEDPTFRRCFEDILTGNWRKHDPFHLEGRLDARSSLYGRPNQSSIFRSFQGWLAMRCTITPPFQDVTYALSPQRDSADPGHSARLPRCPPVQRVPYSQAILHPDRASRL